MQKIYLQTNDETFISFCLIVYPDQDKHIERVRAYSSNYWTKCLSSTKQKPKPKTKTTDNTFEFV